MTKRVPVTYREAGVDIDAGEELVERIKPQVKRSMRREVLGGIGGFGALYRLDMQRWKNPILVSSADGVGTKLRVAIDTQRHDTVGIDLVAMCVNDVVVQGAEPLFFLDYFATGKLDVDVGAAASKPVAHWWAAKRLKCPVCIMAKITISRDSAWASWRRTRSSTVPRHASVMWFWAYPPRDRTPTVFP